MGQKLSAIIEHCDKAGITLAEVAYMGDDINCYDLLKAVGYPACPANAQEIIKSIPKIHITRKSGGQGAIREWINHLFEQKSFASAGISEER